VEKWRSDFKFGPVGTTDNERIGTRNRASGPENKAPVEVAILDNKRVTVRELEHALGSSITLSCLNIVGHVSTSIGSSSGFIVNVRRFSVTSQCC
jgi:hypothetical protein